MKSPPYDNGESNARRSQGFLRNHRLCLDSREAVDRDAVPLYDHCLNWPELKGVPSQVSGFGRVKRPVAESAYRVEKEKISGKNRRILW